MKKAKVKRLIEEAFKDRDRMLKVQHVAALVTQLREQGIRIDIGSPYDPERSGDDE